MRVNLRALRDPIRKETGMSEDVYHKLGERLHKYPVKMPLVGVFLDILLPGYLAEQQPRTNPRRRMKPPQLDFRREHEGSNSDRAEKEKRCQESSCGALTNRGRVMAARMSATPRWNISA